MAREKERERERSNRKRHEGGEKKAQKVKAVNGAAALPNVGQRCISRINRGRSWFFGCGMAATIRG